MWFGICANDILLYRVKLGVLLPRSRDRSNEVGGYLVSKNCMFQKWLWSEETITDLILRTRVMLNVDFGKYISKITFHIPNWESLFFAFFRLLEKTTPGPVVFFQTFIRPSFPPLLNLQHVHVSPSTRSTCFSFCVTLKKNMFYYRTRKLYYISLQIIAYPKSMTSIYSLQVGEKLGVKPPGISELRCLVPPMSEMYRRSFCWGAHKKLRGLRSIVWRFCLFLLGKDVCRF